MERHLKTGGIKLFYYHNVNGSNPVSSFLMTYHKNHYVINTREHLKHIEDCNSINNPAGKNKSFKTNFKYCTKNWKFSVKEIFGKCDQIRSDLLENFFFLAVTIPSSGTILVTTDESNNTWNKKITYMKKIRLCIRSSCALEKGTFVIANCSSEKKVNWRNDKTRKLLDLQIRTRTIALKVLMILTALLLRKTTLNSKEKKRKRKRKEKKRKEKRKLRNIPDPVDIFRRWCKLNFGPMQDQV